MSTEDPKTTTIEHESHADEPVKALRPGAGLRAVAAGVGVAAALVVGAGAGALAMNVLHPRDQQALLPPVQISAMADDSLVAVKGQVAEIFGNKFIIADQSGRALVDTGPGGEGGTLVKVGEEVTAQGRFDDGSVHASMVAHADGKVDELRAPPPPPPHGHGPRGPGPLGPPDAGPDAPRP
jgi:hypothetical protein